jgi:hypothetical protein
MMVAEVQTVVIVIGYASLPLRALAADAGP